MSTVDRRTFLLGAAGLAGATAFLASCGDAADSEAGATRPDVSSTGPDSSLEPLAVPLLVASFPDGFRGPTPFVHSVEQRLGYALHDGVDIMRRNAPESVRLDVLLGGENVGGGEILRRDVGVPTPYYPVWFTPPEAGTYTTVLTWGGDTTEHEFLVQERSETTIPQPGDILPPIDTATFDNARGVDPLCTRSEPCPFHTTNLVDALGTGAKATVLSIATPGFCQTAICGPVIDLLIDAAASRDDLHVIHAEVYLDPNNDDGVQTGNAQTTAIVEAYGLPFEPVLFIVDATGTIVRRIDAIYDGSELAEALALI